MTEITNLHSNQDGHFPDSTFETMGYKDWVAWSHHQALNDTPAYQHEMQRMQQLTSGFIAEEEKYWRKDGLITGPSNKGRYRFIHHFSGDIEGKHKLVFIMLNPRLGKHILTEYQLQAQHGVWKAARDRYKFIHSYYKMNKGSLWHSMRNAGRIIEGCLDPHSSKKISVDTSKAWKLMDEHGVLIDIIPYFSNNWELEPSGISKQVVWDYLEQTLAVFSEPDFLPEPRGVFFIGAPIREYFKQNQEDRKNHYYFKPEPEINERKFQKVWLLRLKAKELDSYILNFPKKFSYIDELCRGVGKLIES